MQGPRYPASRRAACWGCRCARGSAAYLLVLKHVVKLHSVRMTAELAQNEHLPAQILNVSLTLREEWGGREEVEVRGRGE